jgi:hypothetical protein
MCPFTSARHVLCHQPRSNPLNHAFLCCTISGFSNSKAPTELRHAIRERYTTLLLIKDVKFVDVLAFDALTSMSNLLAESTTVFCTLYGLLWTTETSDCMHRFISPMLASLPYIIRAWQCYLTWYKAGNRPQLINLGKYCAVLPVLWLPVMKYSSTVHMLDMTPVQVAYDRWIDGVWLYAVIIYTAYTFTWDVFMDWGLAWPDATAPVLLRSRLMYSRVWYYYAAMIVNLVLRMCWTLRLSPQLQKHASADAFRLLFELLEVFRRFVWIFFRVEWECVKESYTTPPPSPALPDNLAHIVIA